MNLEDTKAKSFVTIMIVAAVAALLLRFTASQLIRINTEQNESIAASTLKLISTALENYARDNQGTFPKELSVLRAAPSVYLDRNYIADSPLKGYSYDCSNLSEAGYNCFAVPVKCGLTGGLKFTVTTGGLLISEKCAKED